MQGFASFASLEEVDPYGTETYNSADLAANHKNLDL
jgi:hypothetical protein